MKTSAVSGALRRGVLFLILAAGQLLPLSGPVRFAPPDPQSKANPAQEPLRNEVTVTLKLVQVCVVDAQGSPARDLEKSDFILYDNGRLQVITDFEKHLLSVPEETTLNTKLPPAREAASLLNRKFLFVLDYEHNNYEGIGKSRKAIGHFLDTQIQPGDEIALFSYSRGRGLVLHEYMTSDHKKIREAIKKVLDIPSQAAAWDPWADGGHSILGPEISGPASLKGDPGLATITATDGSTGQAVVVSRRSGGAGEPHLRSLPECLTDLSKALRHIPGQKNIILFSMGFGRQVFKPKELDNREFVAMGQALASANSPVFSVHIVTGDERQRARVLSDGTLEYLSQMTGGKYFPDVGYDSRIGQEIQNATSNYYVLGYSIAANWDGKFHDIRVEVQKPGYKVFAQRGYFNPLPFAQLTPIEKHLHLLDLALGEKGYFEQHLNFPLIALPFAENRKPNTAFLSEIPVSRIREVVGDRTEFIILVFDPGRTIVDSLRTEIDWGSIGPETVLHYSTLALTPGRYDCRVVIRNLVTGKAAVGACSVEIPEPSTAALKLYPPLLLGAGRTAPVLHIAGQDKEAAANISLFQLYPYPVGRFAPLLDGRASGMSLLYAELRCAGAASREAELKPSARLESEAGGNETPVPCRVIDRVAGDEGDIFFLEFEIQDLPAGRYSLRILAEDPATQLRSQTESLLMIGTGSEAK